MRIPGRTAAVALALTMTIGTGVQATVATAANADVPKPLPASKLNVVAAKSTIAKRTTANLRMRAKATTASATLAVIPKGTKLTVLATSGKWSKVNYAGKTGWSSNSYLEAVASSSNSSSGTFRYTTANLNLRTGAGTTYRSVGVIPAGEKIKIYRYSGNWAQISSSRGTGWVSKTYLGKAPASQKPQPEGTSSTVAYASVGVNLRSGAGTGYRVLGIVQAGEKVTVRSSSNGWSKVSSRIGSGYISSKYLTSSELHGVRSDTQLVVNTVRRLFAGDFTTLGTIRPGSSGHSSGRAVDVVMANYKSASGIQAGDRIARFLLDNRQQLGISYLIWRDKIWLSAKKGWEPYSTSGKYGTQFTNNWTDTTKHMDHIHVETHGESATGGALNYRALNY